MLKERPKAEADLLEKLRADLLGKKPDKRNDCYETYHCDVSKLLEPTVSSSKPEFQSIKNSVYFQSLQTSKGNGVQKVLSK